MKLIGKLRDASTVAFYLMLAVAGLLVVPGLVSLAFMLLGFDLDWSRWTTYLGILLVTAGLLLT